MTETKHAKIKVTTCYTVSGKLASYYDGPALIHDEVNETFDNKKTAEAFCQKQDWLDSGEEHLKVSTSYDIIEVVD